MPKTKQKELDELLYRRAWQRQKLGLSIAEYNALTPREVEIELKACRELEDIRREETKYLARLIDEHLAYLECLFFNRYGKRAYDVDEFVLTRKKKQQQVSPELVAFNIKIRARAQERLRKKGRL